MYASKFETWELLIVGWQFFFQKKMGLDELFFIKVLWNLAKYEMT